MSAIVCGKRSLLDEFNSINGASASSPSSSSSSSSPSSYPKFKKIRCCSPSLSPPRPHFSLSHQSLSLLQHLAAQFPEMGKQLLENTLEECGDDLDLAIKSLTQLRLGSVLPNATCELPPDFTSPDGTLSGEDAALSSMSGSDWAELLINEMKNATNMDDARACASRALELFKKLMASRAAADAAKENMMLKEQAQALLQENSILKRAVAVQFERQKEFESKNQELQQLKQLVAQYEEQVRTLEVNNYALSMHLKQAQQSSSIPGRFHPDIF